MSSSATIIDDPIGVRDRKYPGGAVISEVEQSIEEDAEEINSKYLQLYRYHALNFS